MTILVALIALCVANMMLIWQVTTLIGKVDEMHANMHATARLLERMEAARVRLSGRQKEEES